MTKKSTDFFSIFRDDNTWNEKTIIGFISFAIMVTIAVVDVMTGLQGKSLEIKEYIYQSFVYVTIGSFGIAGLEKFSPSNVKRVERERGHHHYDDYEESGGYRDSGSRWEQLEEEKTENS